MNRTEQLHQIMKDAVRNVRERDPSQRGPFVITDEELDAAIERFGIEPSSPTVMSKMPQEAIEALNWANFDEIKLNREWLPDDQELIYTAINAYNGEGDMDDDCLEQIIERLLLAWRRAEAARAQRAEVEPVAWQWRWKNNSCPWDQGRVPNWVKEAGDVVEERALYTAPPAPQPTEREKVLEEALQKIASWTQTEQLLWWQVEARAALAGKAISQTEREKLLEEALRPFAKLAKIYDPDEGDNEDKCWVHEYTPTLGDLRRARAALAGKAISQTEREKLLEEALRPFAKLAKIYDPDEGDNEDKCWVHEYTPTLGDLRRARAALAGEAPTQTGRAEGGA